MLFRLPSHSLTASGGTSPRLVSILVHMAPIPFDVEDVSTSPWSYAGLIVPSVTGEGGLRTLITPEPYSSISYLGLTPLVLLERIILIHLGR